MKIVQFKIPSVGDHNNSRIGLLRDGDIVVDVNAVDALIPNSVVEFLYREDALETLRKIQDNPKKVYRLKDVKLISPITKPDKILGVSSNYKSDCDRRNIAYTREPVVFSKFSSVITGPFDAIPKPVASNAFDWEAEIAVVIGRTARHVKASEAMDYVLGYTGTQDLTARDWVIRNGGQLVMCKNMDGFCPLGPCVVTKDEMGDPYNIRVRTWVNKDLKQDGNSKEMIHRIDEIIEYLTSAMTLLPGDIICTGTPFGIGASQVPAQYLKKGDVLETEIEKVGRMINTII